MGRLLGIDYGERRIGLAVSDPTGTIAQPLPPLLRRRGKRPPLARLVTLAREHDVAAFVVGWPLDLEGEEGPRAAEVRRFAERLGARAGLPVHLWDERLSTARAERFLREMGIHSTESRAKGRADTLAALLILQAYLDANPGPNPQANPDPDPGP
jgi:putative Holliday junction resolvase